MKIYIDVCCLNRPYDDQTQDRIHLESEAVITILKHVESEKWLWLSSGVVNYEINKTSDEERKCRLQSLVSWATDFVTVDQGIFVRAKEIQRYGIKTYDALHVACAEQGGANILLTTDDNLLKNTKKHDENIKIEVENPLIWLQKVM